MVPNFVAAFSSEIYSGLEPLGTYVWISLTDFVIEYCFEDFGTAPRHMDHNSRTSVMGNHFEGLVPYHWCADQIHRILLD